MDPHSGIEKDDIVAYSSFDKSSKRKVAMRTLLIIAFALALLIFLAVAVIGRYFRVDTIVIDGTEKYSFSEICECGDLKEGKLIFLFSQKTIESELKQRFPYIKSVEVTKKYPSSVYLSIREEKALYYVTAEGEYFVITDQLKVLERYTEKERLLARYPELKEVRTTLIYKIVAPQKIEFQQEKDQKYIEKVLCALADWKGFDKIQSVDISNKFDITVEYDNRISVEMGNRYDFDKKLNMVTAIIASYSERATGKINVKNVEEGIARLTEPEEGKQP